MSTGGWNYVAVVCWWGYVLVITLIALTLPAAECQEYIAEGCPGGKEGSPPVQVNLTCPEGQVISLGEAKFGRNKYVHCTITDGDCLDKTDAFEGCEGRSNCTVDFDQPFSPSCGYVTFITVTYDCQTAPSTPPPIVQTTLSTWHDVSRPAITTIVRTYNRKGEIHPGSIKSGDSDDDNMALIMGSAVAVIITVILLIIAIVMVVRRLACGMELSDEEEKKSTPCHIMPCVHMEQNESDPKPGQDEAGSHDSGEGDDKKRSKRKRKYRGRGADKNQNMSPRLAPVGQEDEDSSASPNKTMAAAQAGSHSEMGMGSGSSARSSVVMETISQTKRHSSGGKSAYSEITKEQGREGSEAKEFSRREGEGWEGKGLRREAQTQGRGVESLSGSFKTAKVNFSAANQDRGHPSRIQNRAAKKHTKVIPKQHQQFDAIALPNTETFTAC